MEALGILGFVAFGGITFAGFVVFLMFYTLVCNSTKILKEQQKTNKLLSDFLSKIQ